MLESWKIRTGKKLVHRYSSIFHHSVSACCVGKMQRAAASFAIGVLSPSVVNADSTTQVFFTQKYKNWTPKFYKIFIFLNRVLPPPKFFRIHKSAKLWMAEHAKREKSCKGFKLVFVARWKKSSRSIDVVARVLLSGWVTGQAVEF